MAEPAPKAIPCMNVPASPAPMLGLLALVVGALVAVAERLGTDDWEFLELEKLPEDLPPLGIIISV